MLPQHSLLPPPATGQSRESATLTVGCHLSLWRWVLRVGRGGGSLMSSQREKSHFRTVEKTLNDEIGEFFCISELQLINS